ncbi:hypothetical protein IAU59_005713 [Kwoniella sp. CBS 9459]
MSGTSDHSTSSGFDSRGVSLNDYGQITQEHPYRTVWEAFGSETSSGTAQSAGDGASSGASSSAQGSTTAGTANGGTEADASDSTAA